MNYELAKQLFDGDDVLAETGRSLHGAEMQPIERQMMEEASVAVFYGGKLIA